MLTGNRVGGWYDVVVGDDGETHGRVELYLQLTPALDNVEFGTYFPETAGNHVTLYQDADTPPLSVFQGVTSVQGGQYTPTRCWRDLYTALCSAQSLIYITGWSVYINTSLLRGQHHGDQVTVGALLKQKAAEGVTVLIMTWNERTNDGGLLDGLLGTHDEETEEYFRDTGVVCANVSRHKVSWMGLGGQFVSTIYTHHQKSIIVDTAPANANDGKRRLVAFLGGLDITDGRYDTPLYPLFSTLRTHHEGDFYQTCTLGATKTTGPRQPWHDIHAKLEGPAVKHVIQNFHERWTNQNPDRAHCLLSLDNFDPMTTAEGQPSSEEDWNVRILRSITADSAKFEVDREKYLHRKYGRLIDNSIERHYIKLIRSAEDFIYVENQYFLGSSYSWLKEKDTRSEHTIPMELTMKIVNKVKAGQSFKVYVCIPMFPEGDPTSDASQEILYWQYCTMEAMYQQIALAIHESGSNTHPQDYLNFYCLGKRETANDVPDYLDLPEASTPAARARLSLRHMIYVHSKLLIVDDKHVVLGSANINQRSLDGNRDSEICLAGHQPSRGSRGEVHVFRLALWSAHLGGYKHEILSPGTDQCLALVRDVANTNWSRYTADHSPDDIDTTVHLLPYPVHVSGDGHVSALPSPWHNFPDTDASVIGSKSTWLPAKLTT